MLLSCCWCLLRVPSIVFAVNKLDALGDDAPKAFAHISAALEKFSSEAGLEFATDAGFYVGGWGSGVDFGEGDPDYEFDYFVGYNVDLSEKVNFDVMLNHYSYPGSSELAYTELITKTIRNMTMGNNQGRIQRSPVNVNGAEYSQRSLLAASCDRLVKAADNRTFNTQKDWLGHKKTRRMPGFCLGS